jgi:hypothetical protein
LITTYITTMPRYGWNIAKVGIKHQPTLQHIRQSLSKGFRNKP